MRWIKRQKSQCQEFSLFLARPTFNKTVWERNFQAAIFLIQNSHTEPIVVAHFILGTPPPPPRVGNKTECIVVFFNPYPANVENIVNS